MTTRTLTPERREAQREYMARWARKHQRTKGRVVPHTELDQLTEALRRVQRCRRILQQLPTNDARLAGALRRILEPAMPDRDQDDA